MSAAEVEMFRKRYGLDSGPPAGAPPTPEAAAAPPAEAVPGGDPNAVPGTTPVVAGPLTIASNTNELAVISITYRAVSLSAISPSANTETAFAVLNELKSSPLFDAEQTQFNGNISADEPPGTFTFGVNVKLKNPLKF
jgi:hypothetical protein